MKISIFLLLFLALFIVQCEQNHDPLIGFTENAMPEIWTDAQIQEYFDTYDYPDDPLNYKMQFYNRKHRSQLSESELAEVLAIEAKVQEAYQGGKELRKQQLMQQIQNAEQMELYYPSTSLAKIDGVTTISAYYFYVPYQNPSDWEDFDIANMLYGLMIEPQSYNPWVWDTNTNYMTSTSTVTACRSFLVQYAQGSTITGLISSTPTSSPASSQSPPTWGYDVPLGGSGGMLAKTTGVNGTMSVPTGYVFSDLNPSFETYSGTFPAWNVSISSPYNIPSTWNNYYAAADVSRQTSHSAGSYSAGLYLSRNVGKVLASGYFQLPSVAMESGDWYATIDYGGNPQSVVLAFEFSLYDIDDNLIGTGSGVISPETDYSFKTNMIQFGAYYDTPKYVRFAVIQQVGQNRNTVYVDNVTLTGPIGDVPLPVELLSFSIPYGYSGSTYMYTVWETASELDNSRWWLYYRNASGTLVKASSQSEPGLGNSSSGKVYTKSWYLYSSFRSYYNSLPSGSHCDIVLADESINGVIHFNEDKKVTLTK